MLIKEADELSAQLEALERLAKGKGPKARQAAENLRRRKAGVRGERNSTYLIGFEYERSPDWAVIHDLRLEHGGRVAQFDHFSITRGRTSGHRNSSPLLRNEILSDLRNSGFLPNIDRYCPPR